MKMRILVLVGCAFIFGIACQKKPKIYSPQEWRDMLDVKYDSQFIHPTDPKEQVHCQEYGVGCTGAQIVRTRNQDFIVVEFDSIENAQNEAKRIGQWFAKNLVFDDVMGEFLLEEVIEQVFQATPAVIYHRANFTPSPRPKRVDRRLTPTP